ncbi:DHH family phosphoesterase [Halopseudomonas pachastrellae]|uniref:DHH family phosphoesterase n=1 Tax=Halopseudomonas pachastrellae TaxID=254161 RepID=UPI003D7E60D0
MRAYDVFNGDADGICALLQLRLAEPRDSELITGVKRDIALLRQLPLDQPLNITALDISLEKNREAVDKLIAGGSKIFYCDHHHPGDSLPEHPAFQALIDTQPTICTSLLIDQHLGHRFHNWAIAAAFGDNLNAVAESLAHAAGLSEAQTLGLQQLGICINYNGYGSQLDDLHFHPAELFRALLPYPDPLQLLEERPLAWQQLSEGYSEDMQRGLQCSPVHQSRSAIAIVLPDQPWSRRVSGVLGNELANRNPDQACAVITEADPANWVISIRAPLNNRSGADELARQFPTGGGRKAAAGINALPKDQLDHFVQALDAHWQ